MLAEIISWFLLVVAVLTGIIIVILIIGSLMPRAHVVSRSLHTHQSREAVWQVITDYAGVPTWHVGVLSAARLPDRCGHAVWREMYKGGFSLQLETVQAMVPERLVRSITDEKGPFSGRWEFTLTEETPGSRITITEQGVIANPFIRFMARLFMNPAQYLEQYLQALAGKLQEKAVIERKDG